MSHWPVINLLDFPSYKHLRVLHDTVALFFQLPFCPAPEGLWLSCTAFPEPALHSFLFVTRVAPKQPTEVNVVPVKSHYLAVGQCVGTLFLGVRGL